MITRLLNSRNEAERKRHGVHRVVRELLPEPFLRRERLPEALRVPLVFSAAAPAPGKTVELLPVPAIRYGLHHLPHCGIFIEGAVIGEQEQELPVLEDADSRFPHGPSERFMQLHIRISPSVRRQAAASHEISPRIIWRPRQLVCRTECGERSSQTLPGPGFRNRNQFQEA